MSGLRIVNSEPTRGERNRRRTPVPRPLVVMTSAEGQHVITVPPEKKSLLDAYLLAIPLGFLGLHHFYLKRPAYGVLYVFTFGLLGVGWLVDLCRLPCLVNSYNQKEMQRIPGKVMLQTKNLSDAYVLWFPFGLLGFHHYYLGRFTWGLAYTFTFGLLGIGWLVDSVRLPCLVTEVNKQIAEDYEANGIPLKKASDAFLLAVTPLGLLGAHHYYLDRHKWGLLYSFSLGLCGIGWMYDLMRIWILVERANKKRKQQDPFPKKYYDDAYILWFPLGFLGLHHFYLKRNVWGILYLCTGGLFLIGWLIDIARIPFLVRAANKKLVEDTMVTCIISGNGREPIVTRHPAGDVRIRVPVQPPSHNYPPPDAPSGLILQPPAYGEDNQPPSYDSIITADQQGDTSTADQAAAETNASPARPDLQAVPEATHQSVAACPDTVKSYEQEVDISDEQCIENTAV